MRFDGLAVRGYDRNIWRPAKSKELLLHGGCRTEERIRYGAAEVNA
jgi:hypothetical protein